MTYVKRLNKNKTANKNKTKRGVEEEEEEEEEEHGVLRWSDISIAAIYVDGFSVVYTLHTGRLCQRDNNNRQ